MNVDEGLPIQALTVYQASLLRSNFLLSKQNIILHILEKVKETQIKVLGEEPSLPRGLLKSFFMLLHSLILVNE